MKKLESLNSNKFESFAEHKLAALTSIIGGMTVSATGATGSDLSYGYDGHPDAKFTDVANGDTKTGWPAITLTASTGGVITTF